MCDGLVTRMGRGARSSRTRLQRIAPGKGPAPSHAGCGWVRPPAPAPMRPEPGFPCVIRTARRSSRQFVRWLDHRFNPPHVVTGEKRNNLFPLLPGRWLEGADTGSHSRRRSPRQRGPLPFTVASPPSWTAGPAMGCRRSARDHLRQSARPSESAASLGGTSSRVTRAQSRWARTPSTGFVRADPVFAVEDALHDRCHRPMSLRGVGGSGRFLVGGHNVRQQVAGIHSLMIFESVKASMRDSQMPSAALPSASLGWKCWVMSKSPFEHQSSWSHCCAH